MIDGKQCNSRMNRCATHLPWSVLKGKPGLGEQFPGVDMADDNTLLHHALMNASNDDDDNEKGYGGFGEGVLSAASSAVLDGSQAYASSSGLHKTVQDIADNRPYSERSIESDFRGCKQIFKPGVGHDASISKFPSSRASLDEVGAAESMCLDLDGFILPSPQDKRMLTAATSQDSGERSHIWRRRRHSSNRVNARLQVDRRSRKAALGMRPATVSPSKKESRGRSRSGDSSCNRRRRETSRPKTSDYTKGLASAGAFDGNDDDDNAAAAAAASGVTRSVSTAVSASDKWCNHRDKGSEFCPISAARRRGGKQPIIWPAKECILERQKKYNLKDRYLRMLLQKRFEYERFPCLFAARCSSQLCSYTVNNAYEMAKRQAARIPPLTQ